MVPPPEPQGPEIPGMPPMPQGPQDPYIEGNITNADKRIALRDMTQVMMTQNHVVTNHVVAKANIEV